MCGIAGRLNLSGRPVTAAEIEAMCATLRHRGPDDQGLLLDGPFGMGVRRLSIIDLATGRQPLRGEDGRVWTVFNGEIYNFRERRRELEARGHRFATAADTEVIVHLYEEHGEGVAARLAGMFAFAVWDAGRRRLLLARDRLGIKPLYWARTPTALLFGSELKTLLAAGVDREVDRQALHDYLSLGYVPGPRTILRHIAKLPPGHLLACEAGTVTVRPYWRLQYPDTPPAPRPDDAWAEELDALLRDAVRQHLVSDVPLGVFLSGGMDSSSLVAHMREVSPQTVRTFSIGFRDPSYDELGTARVVARAFETDHRELVVDPPSIDVLADLARCFDEPFADSSAVAVHAVARLAREHVTVALSGEGGDEVFAGYQTYVAGRLADVYRRLPAFLARRVVPTLVRRLPVSHRRVSFDYKAKRFVEGALLPAPEAHYAWKVLLTEADKARLYAEPGEGLVDPVEHYRRLYAGCGAADMLTRLQHIDLSLYLPDDLLVKADRMSMANSLEVRVPFLDHRVVEFALSLPAPLRLRGLTTKYALRRAMRGRLPAVVLQGRKRGFNVPVPGWLRRELRDPMREVLSPKRLRDSGYFDPRAVETLLAEHGALRVDRSRPLWALLMFMLWHEEYVVRTAFAPATRLAA